MAGWIRIPLGMEVGLDTGDIVLDGARLPHGKGHSSPHFSAHVYCGQTVAAHLSNCWALAAATHTFIHKWNEPYLPLLPSHRASPHFGRYSFSVPLRVVGWGGYMSIWLYKPRWFTRPQTVTHPSINRVRRRITSLINTSVLLLSQTVSFSWLKCERLMCWDWRGSTVNGRRCWSGSTSCLCWSKSTHQPDKTTSVPPSMRSFSSVLSKTPRLRWIYVADSHVISSYHIYASCFPAIWEIFVIVVLIKVRP